jgi:23S rRNA (guanosine2251-2'-O)-methyltransferase
MSRRKLSNEELQRKSIPAYKEAGKLPLVIVLDNVRSLNNIGSVFRTADAFLLESIYLCGFTATPPHRDIHKTALGATESVNWKHFSSTYAAITELRADGFKIVCLEQTQGSIPLFSFSPARGIGYAMVFGNEVRGVSQEVIDASDECIEIPQFGTKHSFNIAVSAGIVLWDFYLKVRDPRQ